MVARINIDSRFWDDPRVGVLCKQLNDEDKAYGMCLRAWKVAQRYWVKNRLVPKKTFNGLGLAVLMDVDLAEEREDGIYVRGSQKEFAWYVASAVNGKKGGRSAAKTVETQTEPRPNPVETQLGPVTNPEGNLFTLSSSLSSLSSSLNKNTFPAERSPSASLESADAPVEKKSTRKSKRPPTDGSEVWEAYRKSFAEAHGDDPARSAKENTACKNLVKAVGKDLAIQIAAFYPTQRDGWIEKQCHPLGLLYRDLSKWKVKFKDRNTSATEGWEPKESDFDRAVREENERTRNAST